MKKFLTLILAFAFAACTTAEFRSGYDPYSGILLPFTLEADIPGLSQSVTFTVKNLQSGASYSAESGAAGKAEFRLAAGLYSVHSEAIVDDYLWSYSADRIDVGATPSVKAAFIRVEPGDLLIKEVYCGGCKDSVEVFDSTLMAYVKTLQTHQTDKYFILHNNCSETLYLDSLCFGTLSPANATGNNKWLKYDDSGLRVYDDFVPVYQAVWQFGGGGADFPLAPGEDAVVCICGAIDHTKLFPSSVNLNRSGYFVCYDEQQFWNTNYHPVPGDQIQPSHILSVVIKTGVANGYTFSISSPTLVIFKAQGCTIQEFVQSDEVVIQEPGSNYDKVVKVPCSWVLDAMEVFDGSRSNNVKRLPPELDGGCVYQAETYLGVSLLRRRNEERSAELGREVLVDTNNSSNDFYQSSKPTLRDE